MSEATLKLNITEEEIDVEIIGDTDTVAKIYEAISTTLIDDRKPDVAFPHEEEPKESRQIKKPGSTDEPEARGAEDEKPSIPRIAEKVLEVTEPGKEYKARDIAQLTENDTQRVASAIRIEIPEAFDVERTSRSNVYERKRLKKTRSRAEKDRKIIDDEDLNQIDEVLKRQRKEDRQLTSGTVGNVTDHMGG